MANPAWVTPPGDLGTVTEGQFYQIQLNADNATTYAYHSGVLPDGIEIKPDGGVEGQPRNYDYIQGVPQEVALDVTSRFVVRATSVDGGVADRVFQLTVTGQDAPTINKLPDSDLGSFFDGDVISVQLTATDPDPQDTLTWKFNSGDLPAGLEISTSGLISGVITPVADLTGTPGYDVTNFDMQPYEFRTKSENKTYEWMVEVTDGKEKALKAYRMFVASRNNLSADTDLFTCDGFAPTAVATSIEAKLTSDLTTIRNPYMITKAADLGTVTHDNFFVYQFEAADPDGDVLNYTLSVGAGIGYDVDNFDMSIFDRGTRELPPGLSVDTTSGWFTGNIPIQSATKKDYEFSVRAYKQNNSDYASKWVNFKMTIEGTIDSTIAWPNANLGSLQTGEISQLDVTATITGSRPVVYELKKDTTSKLPQGVKLDQNGLIVGRASFETMMFDTGLTTFDIEDVRTQETTFEREYKFTVRAYSNDLVIDTYQEFTLTIENSSLKPYESLYIRALPQQTQRDIFEALINNADDIPTDAIYRPSDPYFGLQKDIRALVATGLNPSPETNYIQAMAQNHWNNLLRFGKFGTAKAYEADGSTVKYEIVYVELKDFMMGTDPATKKEAPASQKINLTLQTGWENPITIDSISPKVSSGNMTVDSKNDHIAYPNAIQNMRNRLLDKLGSAILERFVLPEWMQDKQEDGTVIGWKLVAPIVYCKPDTSGKVRFLLEKRTTIDLKKLSFEVDRYILDNNLSKYYDKTTGKYTASAETTFDIGSVASTVVSTVDYVSQYSFDTVNNVLAQTAAESGYIKGAADADALNGKHIIFQYQTSPLGLYSLNDGWNQIFDTYDAIGFEQMEFGKYEILPGFFDKLTGNSDINKRAGIWKINVINGFIKLEFVKEVIPGNQVKVTYENTIFYYEKTSSGGNNAPNYVDVQTVNLLAEGSSTESTFDGRGTRFYADVDVYAAVDEGDKYIKFPRVGVFR